MKKLKIFLSRDEISYEAGVKIKETSLIETEILYIEDFVQEKLWNTITDDDIIHFSCNSDLIKNVLEKIKDKKCYIYNKEYLLKNHNKKEIQLKLEEIGIRIPEIYSNIDNVKFPVFIKENKHTGIILEAYTPSTLKYLLEKMENKNYYLEESIHKNVRKEIKVYVVNKKVYFKDGEKINKEIKRVSENIANYFNDIEIYSADFIVTDKGYYFIDFNAAVGFYKTKKGRKAFVDSAYKIAYENKSLRNRT